MCFTFSNHNFPTFQVVYFLHCTSFRNVKSKWNFQIYFWIYFFTFLLFADVRKKSVNSNTTINCAWPWFYQKAFKMTCRHVWMTRNTIICCCPHKKQDALLQMLFIQGYPKQKVKIQMAIAMKLNSQIFWKMQTKCHN